MLKEYILENMEKRTSLWYDKGQILMIKSGDASGKPCHKMRLCREKGHDGVG